MSPAHGGTELMADALRRACPEYFPVFDDPDQDRVQLVMSRPESVVLRPVPRILWLQDLPQDAASQCLRERSVRAQFNAMVFNSYFQQHEYARTLGIPFREGTVIRNAPVDGGAVTKPPVDPLRFVYTSSPRRGLAVLAAVASQLAELRRDWVLDVYSSLKVYGWDDADAEYTRLYDALRAIPGVTYHGAVSNAVVRAAVRDAHVWVYPSTFPETSCLAAQEALMAGCLTITTTLGALPETCAPWAWLVPYSEDWNDIATHLLQAMSVAIDRYGTAGLRAFLAAQQQFYRQFWTFESRVPVWRAVLARVTAEGVRDGEAAASISSPSAAVH